MMDGVNPSVIHILSAFDKMNEILFSIDKETGELTFPDLKNKKPTSCLFALKDFSAYVILFKDGAYSSYFNSFLDAYEFWQKDPVRRSLHGVYCGVGEATLVNFRKERRTNG